MELEHYWSLGLGKETRSTATAFSGAENGSNSNRGDFMEYMYHRRVHSLIY